MNKVVIEQYRALVIVNTGARTPNWITRRGIHGFICCHILLKNIVEYDVNQQSSDVYTVFDIFVTISPVILRKCWRNFLKIVMPLL